MLSIHLITPCLVWNGRIESTIPKIIYSNKNPNSSYEYNMYFIGYLANLWPPNSEVKGISTIISDKLEGID